MTREFPEITKNYLIKLVALIVILIILVTGIQYFTHIQVENGEHYQITSTVTDKKHISHRAITEYFFVAQGKIIECNKKDYENIQLGKEYTFTISQIEKTEWKFLVDFHENT